MDGCDIWTFQFFLAILLKETVTRDRNRLNVSWLDRAYTLGNNQNCLVFFYFNHPFIRPCLDTWLPFEFGFKFVNIHAIFAGLPRALYHFIPHVCTLQQNEKWILTCIIESPESQPCLSLIAQSCDYSQYLQGGWGRCSPVLFIAQSSSFMYNL